ncbi:MAG TPA: 16S rRNA (cytosine(967)-C(5))-methyltransferase RsmB, partial [Candidatus Cloacimonas acidaminovorans]|nr:16S rRNA (cytosine(967)-C(5))-methyltransferase RsmB [Candidatus Cloacimonas acidaminovorans]
ALDYAANFVAPGGFLVYSTCTMNPKENEDQISAFLKKNRNFELIPADAFIPERYTYAGYLKTIPFKHNMDGAFAAKLQRRK